MSGRLKGKYIAPRGMLEADMEEEDEEEEEEDCCWGLKGWTRGEGEEAGKPKKMSEWDGVLVEILSGMDI